MPSFTIETTYRLPIFRQRTYRAATLNQACRLAIDDDDWSGQKEDYESSGATYVTGAWPGADTAYRAPALAVPAKFARPDDDAPVSPRTARYAVGVAFLSEGAPFAREDYVVEASGYASAEVQALDLARESACFNERIPELSCAIRSSEEMTGDPDDILLLEPSRVGGNLVQARSVQAAIGQPVIERGKVEGQRQRGRDMRLAKLRAQRSKLVGRRPSDRDGVYGHRSASTHLFLLCSAPSMISSRVMIQMSAAWGG